MTVTTAASAKSRVTQLNVDPQALRTDGPCLHTDRTVTAHIVSLSAPQGAVAWDESVRAERGAMPGVRSLLVAAATANGTRRARERSMTTRSRRASGVGSLAGMKVRVSLSNGQEHDVIGIDDAKSWMNSFVGRGSSQLGDWLEVVPEEGDGRTFVRASDVVAVHLIDDDLTDGV